MISEKTMYRRKVAKRKAIKEAAKEANRRHKKKICRIGEGCDSGKIDARPMEVDHEVDIAEKMVVDRELDGSEYQLSSGTEQLNNVQSSKLHSPS